MRAIVLKARQMGFSTLTEAIIFTRTATHKNVNSGIVAHKDDSSNNLYAMYKLFYEKLPPSLKPQQIAKNAREKFFDNPKGTGLKSRIRVMTAGGNGIGRSDTFQNLHISEFAFWPGKKEDTIIGLLQAVPNLPNTMVVIESTANGFDEFKERWDLAVAGKNDFTAVFCAWWELEEYRRPCIDFEPTAEEIKIKETYHLDDEQLSWRRWCIENNCGGDINKFHQEYPASPEEAFISTGKCIFDKEAIIAQIANLKPAKRVGDFTFTGEDKTFAFDKFVDDTRGATTIYAEPKDSVPYVIGADTAGDGSDWFVAHVIDNTTGQQVAVLRQQFGEDEFARQLVCLGYYYNTALIGIEANFSTYPIKALEKMQYPKQYVRETEDNYTHKVQQKFGFKTTSTTRPVAIAGLVQIVREQTSLIVDETTLKEMLVFVKNERGRPEAMEGKHDDHVMALAIAHYIRPQQAYEIKKGHKKAKWREDQYKDYYAAGPEMRKEILELWGDPF